MPDSIRKGGEYVAQYRDHGFQELKYKATDATEARITVFLLADRDSKSKAAVHLNVIAIDTDIVKHKR